ncbi:extracellular solute-binding protein, partial [bacterium]
QEANVSYTDESIACYPVGSWNIANIRKSGANRAGEWGVFRLPAFRAGGLRNSNQGGSVLVVPEQSQAVEGASKFVEYALCTVDAQLKQFDAYGLFPAFIPAQRDPRFDRPDPFFGGQHVAKLFTQDFDRVPGLVRTRDWAEAETLIGGLLYDWDRERQDSATWLRRTSKLLSDRLGRELAPTTTNPTTAVHDE